MPISASDIVLRLFKVKEIQFFLLLAFVVYHSSINSLVLAKKIFVFFKYSSTKRKGLYKVLICFLPKLIYFNRNLILGQELKITKPLSWCLASIPYANTENVVLPNCIASLIINTFIFFSSICFIFF